MPVEALVDTAGAGVDVSAEALAVVAACIEERTVEVVVICLQFRDAQDLTLARLRQHRHVVREALDGHALRVGRLRRQTGAFSRDGVGEALDGHALCVGRLRRQTGAFSRDGVGEALDGHALCVGRLRRQTGAFSRDGVGEALDGHALCVGRLRRQTGAFSRDGVGEALDGHALCVGRLRRQTGAFSRDGVGERHSTVTPCVWGAYAGHRQRRSYIQLDSLSYLCFHTIPV